MQRPEKILISACLAAIFGGVPVVAAAAAENAGAVQELGSVTASGEALAARWVRQPESYTLQVQLDATRHAARQKAALAASMEQMAVRPVPVAPSREPVASADRGSSFIRQTIANLRGLDPAFCDRILVLMDGRTPPSPDRGHRVGVSLLRADGSQIVPSGYSCVADSVAIDVQYRYSVADGAQAVSAAVRIDDQFHTEKLQPLAQQPASAGNL